MGALNSCLELRAPASLQPARQPLPRSCSSCCPSRCRPWCLTRRAPSRRAPLLWWTALLWTRRQAKRPAVACCLPACLFACCQRNGTGCPCPDSCGSACCHISLVPTTGAPAHPFPLQWPLNSVLFLAASAEAGSEHPLARAVQRYAALRLAGSTGGIDDGGGGGSAEQAGSDGSGGSGAPPSPSAHATEQGMGVAGGLEAGQQASYASGGAEDLPLLLVEQARLVSGEEMEGGRRAEARTVSFTASFQSKKLVHAGTCMCGSSQQCLAAACLLQ